MSVRPILLWPDPRLQQRCAPAPQGPELSTLVTDLFHTMYAASGRGLAAPQIGEMVRVFVMDTGWKDGASRPVVCVNPEVVSRADKTAPGEEACLSIPGVSADIERRTSLILACRDDAWQPHRLDLQGIDARCALHELDHLDGKVIFDRVQPDARQPLLDRYAAARA